MKRWVGVWSSPITTLRTDAHTPPSLYVYARLHDPSIPSDKLPHNARTVLEVLEGVKRHPDAHKGRVHPVQVPLLPIGLLRDPEGDPVAEELFALCVCVCVCGVR